MPLTATVSQESDLNTTTLLTTTVVLATVTMTFGAMIAVFLFRSGNQKFWGHIPIPGLLWVTTVVLLSSSFMLERARHSLQANQQADAYRRLGWTLGLAIAFLVGQIAAWLEVLHSGIVLAKNPHSWFIFLFTALHGLHILLGVGGLAYLLFRTRETVSGPKYLMKTRVVARGVALFWHYLDSLWIVLFALLLTWRR